MADQPHILLVDDDRDIRDPLATYLGKEGIRVTRADGAAAAREIVAVHAIILLTAKAEEMDRILGLEIGADDYVVKPFSPRELLARIKAVLRRAGGTHADPVHAPDADGFAFGGWILRTGDRELIDGEGVAVPLSTGEFNLLHAFVTHSRRVLSRDQLLDLSAGRELAAFERSIDNHISRLRRKLEADPADPKLIKTIWGGGYMLAADVRRI